MSLEHPIYSHRVYKNDPILFKSYVNKYVKIVAKDSSVYRGVVYTVDPVSESVILATPDVDNPQKYNTKIVVGYSIEEIKVLPETETVLPDLFPLKQLSLSESELAERKEAIKRLMTENQLSIKDKDGTLQIADMVFIEPPYESENCVCSNPIVLNRVKSILLANDRIMA